MALCAVVEAVDLELQPVVAEVVDQVPLEEARRLVGDLPPAEIRVHRQRAEVRDSAAAVADLEAHQAGGLAVDLDHEAAELPGLGLRPFDLGGEPFAVARPPHGKVLHDVVLVHQLEQEIEVLRPGPPDGDAHGLGAATGSRFGSRTAPEPNATPPWINTIPASSCQVSGSPSRATP